jgi:hypothetical protein
MIELAVTSFDRLDRGISGKSPSVGPRSDGAFGSQCLASRGETSGYCSAVGTCSGIKVRLDW